MIPAHSTESKMSPVTQGALSSGDYKEIRSVRVGSSAGARELFTRALRETADGRLRVPILMAPMASACPASLAIAVANAGGLGGCGALLMPPDAIHKWVSDVRAGTNGGFPTQSLDARSAAQARLRRGTPGLAPKPTIIRIRRVLNTANRRMFYGRSVVDFARSKEASTVSQRVIRPCVRMTAALRSQARRHNLERLSSGDIVPGVAAPRQRIKAN
jgi:NAD(P)H-dependent flavin oxidoreductase YrpB (nitropropane dioxygenase family)